MTGESRETEPFQKALTMETGTVIFLKCLSEWFSEKKISRVRKPGAPDTALKSYDFPRFLRQRGNEIGWNTELGGTRNLPSLCTGAVFYFRGFTERRLPCPAYLLQNISRNHLVKTQY